MKSEVHVAFWLAVAVLCGIFLYHFQDVLLPFVIGLVVAYALNPFVEWLERRRISRLFATIAVMGFLCALVVLLFALLVPVLIAQAQQIAVAAPDLIERLQPMIRTWAQESLGSRADAVTAAVQHVIEDVASGWKNTVGLVAKSIWQQSFALVNFLALLFVTPVVIFYLLHDWPSILGTLDRWLPKDHAHSIRRIGCDIDAALSAFIRGQGLVCLMLAAIYAVGLTWAGLRYGILIGAVSGLLSFIPFAGWAVGALTASAFAIAENWPNALPLIKVLIVFALGQVLDAGFLSPRIVGSKVGLHPVWLILAVFVFSYQLGFVGMIIAVPLASAVAVLVRFALEKYQTSTIYRGNPSNDDCAAKPGSWDGPESRGQ